MSVGHPHPGVSLRVLHVDGTELMKKNIGSLLLTAILLFPVIARADEPPKKPWKNETEVSVVSANGNTKTTTSSAKDTFNLNYKKSLLEIIGGGLGSRSKGEVTAERYY